MTRREQLRALKRFATRLRTVADELDALARTGALVKHGDPRVTVVNGLILGGVQLFHAAAIGLRSGKPNAANLKVAEALETTCKIWRRWGPSGDSN